MPNGTSRNKARLCGADGHTEQQNGFQNKRNKPREGFGDGCRMGTKGEQFNGTQYS